MTAIKKLEDFEVWQNARALARDIYLLPDEHPLNRDFAFRDQLRRAAVSTMSNLAESHGRDTDADKARFGDYSRGSASETLSLFILGGDIGYFKGEEAQSFEARNRTILK